MDHKFQEDHGVSFPRALCDELLFKLGLAAASNVAIGSDKTQLAYELANILLEYEVIHSQKVFDEARSKYTNGKRFVYKHFTHLKIILVDKGSDTIINESINVPRRSMKRLLSYKPYVTGVKDSEKTFNHIITEVKVIFSGIPSKVLSQGMEERNMWEEAFRRFGKEDSLINATYFFAGNRFALFIDLRSMKDNDLHGSELRLVNTKDRVQLKINRKA